MAASIVISILANANQANGTLDKTLTKTQKVGAGFRKMAGPATLALGGLAAAGGKAADAAAEDAKSQTILATAATKAANATDKQVASMERFIDKTARATGVADDQLRPAMGALLRSTGSVEKSQRALSQALDISAATGKDVTVVSSALAKGYGGNTAALGKLVPGLDKAVLKSGDMNKITAELARMTGGTAAKAAKTEAGAMARANVARDEAVETIGARLLPVYAKAAKVGAAAANWLGDNEKAAYILAGTIAFLATTVLAVNVAMKLAGAATAIYNGLMATSAAVNKAVTAASLGTRLGLLALGVQTTATSIATKAAAAAQWLLNAAMSANPIGLIVLAIAALVGGFILLYKHSETFRNIVGGALGFVQSAAQKVYGFIKKNWPLLLAILTGPFGLAVLVIAKKWDAIIGGIRSIPGKIRALGGRFKDAGKFIINSVIEGIQNAAGFVKGMAQSIWNAIKGMVNNGIDKINAALEFKINIPGAPDIHVNPPNIPHLAKGGVVRAKRGGVLALLGEAGQDEAVVPLDKYKGGFGGGGTITQTFYVTVQVDPGMTKAEQGKHFWESIRDAQDLGMVTSK